MKESAETFDSKCKDEVKTMLDLSNGCLLERYLEWQKIFGFIQAHLNWFERIREYSNYTWVAGRLPMMKNDDKRISKAWLN